MSDNPVGGEDLNRAVDSLKDHIDDKFIAFQKYDEEVHNNIRSTLKLHSKSLYGNGGTGVVKQVDRVQTSIKTARIMILFFFALFSVVIAYLGLN